MVTEFPRPVTAARKRIIELQRKADSLTEQLERINQEKSNYEAFLKVWFELEPTAAAKPPPQDQELVKQISKMTIPQAVERILERSGGRLPMTHILEILKAAGKPKGNPKNAYSSVSKAMERSPRIERVSKGVWALVSPAKNGAAPDPQRMRMI